LFETKLSVKNARCFVTGRQPPPVEAENQLSPVRIFHPKFVDDSEEKIEPPIAGDAGGRGVRKI
jgi:hypothetical protein